MYTTNELEWKWAWYCQGVQRIPSSVLGQVLNKIILREFRHLTNSRIFDSKRITRTKPNTFWFILGPLTVFPSFPYNEPGEVIVKKLSSQWASNFKGDLFLNCWNEPILAKTEVYLNYTSIEEKG